MKNIEINYLDVSGYEVLYPKTTTENLIDFGEVLYTKEEVDGFIESLRGQTGNLKFTMGSYQGTENIPINSSLTGAWRQIELGFIPEYFVVSEEDESYFYYPFFMGNASSKIGFGPHFNLIGSPALQSTSTGFQVRNLYKESGNYSYRLDFNLLNVTYHYLAFG